MKFPHSFLLLCLLTGCALGPRGLPTSEHIANFGRVNERLFRGAQPDAAGIQSLRLLGVRTILDLRMPGDRWPPEEALARASGIDCISLPLAGLGAPTDEQVARGLEVLAAAPGAVFIHCEHGADRTGTLIAAYRIQREGWTNERAYAEARRYGMSFWQFGMRRYVRKFHPLNDTRPWAAAR